MTPRGPARRELAATTPQRLGAVVKSCRDIMRKDKGLNGDIDRLPMLTWIMFLKFLDDMERVHEDEAALEGTPFRGAIASPYRWRDWNGTPDADGSDGGFHNPLTGDALISFVNNDEAITPSGTRGPGLFAYLRSLEGSRNRIEGSDVVANVFRGTVNRMQSGYLLRDVLDKVNGIHFSSSDEIHTLAHLYESMLKEMRDAAGDSGEFYTPRPLIRLIVRCVNPQLGETVLDPAAGTGGFLVETFDHLAPLCQTVQDRETLQRRTLFGVEAKTLPYLLCEMNLLLHGLEAPQIDPLNALRFRMSEIGDRDRVDVIMTNPPFGGEEERGIQMNFPQDKQTSETALLFLQLIMRKLRRPGEKLPTGGRAGVVVPNGTLSSAGVGARIKEELLTNFDVHTVLRLPQGVFAPYTNIPTNVLFFDRSGPTSSIWFYEHPLPGGRKQYTKTMPLRVEEFEPFLEWLRDKEQNDRAWSVPVEEILLYDESGGLVAADLDQRHPARTFLGTEVPPEELIEDLRKRQQELVVLLEEVARLVEQGPR